MLRCPACKHWIATPICRLCQVPGVRAEFRPPPAPKICQPWMVPCTCASLAAPFVFPYLVFFSWPLLSFVIAHMLFIGSLSRIRDAFVRILVGTLLAMLSGLIAVALLILPMLGALLLWT